MLDDEPKKTSQEKWHVGKEIPIALIFAIIIQTGAGMWWAATVTTKIDDLSYQVAAINADKYTKTDAQKDGALYMTQISDLKNRIDHIDQKIERGQGTR